MKKPFVIWITGLPASGKTTVAKGVVEELRKFGIPVVHLESDQLRAAFTPNPTYSISERDWFYQILVSLAVLIYRNGVSVVIDATGNKRIYREKARQQIANFLEVYLKCPLEVCASRDPKGIYKLAQQKQIQTLPGAQEIYEEPLHPEIMIDTALTDPESATAILLSKLKQEMLVEVK